MYEQTQTDLIRLALVDDQALFRASLGRFLAAQPGLAVVGECATAPEALALLSASPVDIVLVDLDLLMEPGEEFISCAQRAGYQGRFLIVAPEVRAGDLTATLRLGASGIFLKSEAPDRLVQAIRLVASGAVWVDRIAMQRLADQLSDHLEDSRGGSLLTPREEKVILGIVGGLTNRKIGDNIGLSESSVKSVVQGLFVRAGVRTRSQLVRMALEGSLGAVPDLRQRNRNGVGAAALPINRDSEGPIASPVRQSPR
jgi:DNA-binding NarL/FixJ family response regulator